MPLLIEFGVLTGVSCMGATRGMWECQRGEFLFCRLRPVLEIPNEALTLAFLLLEKVS